MDYDKIFNKIIKISPDIKLRELTSFCNSRGFKVVNGSKHSTKIYVNNSMCTIHETKPTLKQGAIREFKKVLIKENFCNG